MEPTVAAAEPGTSPVPSVGRPLVVRFGAIGDMILLGVLLRELHRRWGAPCDLVASGGAPRQVFAGAPWAGEIFTLPSRRMPYWLSAGQRRLVTWLGERGATPTWAVERMEKVLWLLDRGGLGEGCVLSMADLPRGDLEHAAAYHARLAAAIPAAFEAYRQDLAPPPAPLDPGAPADGAPLPQIAVSDAERRDVAAWIEERGWAGRPLVLLQTRSRRRKRGRWPERRWKAVVGAVLEHLPEARAVLIGAPDEEREIAALAASCGDPRVEVAAGDLPLRRLFALLAVAHSCISLDTGPAHAASVLGCPLTVLVGMADPRRNHPVPCGAAVRMVTSVEEARWPDSRAGWEAWHKVETIAVEPVVEGWSEAAAAGRAGGSLGYLWGTEGSLSG